MLSSEGHTDTSLRLSPHEDPWTDVVLLAHSMGGLVAADVALLCRHRIIGVINFDVPFLGMHPGIIKAGLGSIFKPWPAPQDQTTDELDPAAKKPSRLNTLFNPKPNDPNFNPAFPNDVHLPVRKGWENTLHWLNKHSNGIVQASKGLVQSHLEFGGAMADYRTLKARYIKIRTLEEEDEQQRRNAIHDIPHPPRIRFVNYYTTSTGRPKKPKSPKPPKSPSPSRPASRASPKPEDSSTHLAASVSNLHLEKDGSETSTISSRSSTEHPAEDPILEVMPPTPIDDVDPEPSIHQASSEAVAGPTLPNIPPIPKEPPFVDLAQFTDKAQRKAAEKEHDQALKEYQRAVKARNKIINERDKIQEKWEKQEKKEHQLKEKQAQKDQQIEQKQMQKEMQLEESQSQKDTKSEEKVKGKEKADSKLDIEMSKEDVGAVQLGAGESSRSTSNRSPYGNYDFSRSAIMNQAEPNEQASYTTAFNPPSTYNESTYSLTTTDSQSAPGPETPPKVKRLKKFCMLPPEDSQGNKDPTWIRIFMEGIDEVTAHTTLFFVNDTYERLVGDVGARIEEWVLEADSLRLVRELQGL